MKSRKLDILGSLPPEWPDDLLPHIRAAVEESEAKIVVVDDDPTGNQTVYDVPVLTEWSPQMLSTVFAEPGNLVFILTNSRSTTLPRAKAIGFEIGTNLALARKATGREFVVVSRGDSTLRGHYPGEVEALESGLAQAYDARLIIPFFLEGGRFTVGDTHYVADSDWLVPAAETEFARDAAFGYHSSNLRDWVSEKHLGQINAHDVASISLEDLRLGGPEAVAGFLSRLRGGQPCVVNAASYRDLEVLVTGILRAEAAGRRFIYRTAASFVRARAGIPPRGMLTGVEIGNGRSGTGGLVVAGSYVQKSSRQIEAALSLPGVVGLEVTVEKVIDSSSCAAEIDRVTAEAGTALAEGRDTLIYTSRRLIAGTDEETSLQIGQMVSSALVKIVQGLVERPAWVIAKGGITSSDIATKALGVRRAEVLGQSLPGVPIWRTGPESRWPGLTYVVFPGNVGGSDAIAEMIMVLRGEPNGNVRGIAQKH